MFQSLLFNLLFKDALTRRFPYQAAETANSPLRRQQFCIQILVLNSPRISLCEPTSAIQAKEDALRFPPAGSYLVKGQNTVASSLPLPHQILLALLYFSKVIL